jgi:hypothetical protein
MFPGHGYACSAASTGGVRTGGYSAAQADEIARAPGCRRCVRTRAGSGMSARSKRRTNPLAGRPLPPPRADRGRWWRALAGAGVRVGQPFGERVWRSGLSSVISSRTSVPLRTEVRGSNSMIRSRPGLSDGLAGARAVGVDHGCGQAFSRAAGSTDEAGKSPAQARAIPRKVSRRQGAAPIRWRDGFSGSAWCLFKPRKGGQHCGRAFARNAANRAAWSDTRWLRISANRSHDRAWRAR